MASNPSPALYVVSPEGRFLKDDDPEADLLIVSKELELAYALSPATSFHTWSRDSAPGGQPDPSYGAKAWVKTGNLELGPQHDEGFWKAKDALFTRYRNEAAGSLTEVQEKMVEFMKLAAYFAMGALALSLVFKGIETFV